MRTLFLRSDWAVTGALTALAFGLQATRAEVTQTWVHRYSNAVTNAEDNALKVERDAAGNIIVTGTTDGHASGYDMLTIKYSRVDGSVLWQQRYNGPGNFDDFPNSIGVDLSGNVVVAGLSHNDVPCWCYNDVDYYIAKYATADGALLWERRYRGPGRFSDQATAVASDGSGDVVVTGIFYNSGGEGYHTAKFSGTDGALLWEKQVPDRGGYAVVMDANGNVIVGGSLRNADHTFDSYTAKYSAADGALLWEHRSIGLTNSSTASAMAVDGSGNVVETGSSRNESNLDYYTTKYAAADGTLLWAQRYNGPANHDDIPNALAVDGSGNVVVTGNSEGDYYTVKYAAVDGALLWEKRGPAGIPASVGADRSGNVAVTGSSYNGRRSDYYTAKYAAANGALLWEKRYNSQVDGDDYAHAVTIDGSGNVVVTGQSPNQVSWDYYTAKYASANGEPLWETRYDGPSNRDDTPVSLAIDGGGNVLVTGQSQDSVGSVDFYTAKYASAGGALLWEKRQPGEVRALALDASGNAMVTGFSLNGIRSDFYTAKYAASDGSLLWDKRYEGPGLGSQPSAISIDGAGNVVVTGTVQTDSNGGSALYTVKYAAVDGAMLWEKRYAGSINSSSYPTAMWVDPNGNVVVTGYSQGAYTARYAAADGDLLWERRDSGTAARTVKVDSNGNVILLGSYTAKYTAADGALLWKKSYDGSIGRSDNVGAEALVVDGTDNVVVTGFFFGDSYTAKYAGADGSLLWHKMGPGGIGRAVGVDRIGNVVVTGQAQNERGRTDFYTAKYAGADGYLLWEKRYNGPTHGPDDGNDSACCLALGPDGMIAITGNSDADYATIVYREVLTPISIEHGPTGVRLSFAGLFGRSYVVERAKTVAGPWQTLATRATPLTGPLEYVDIELSDASFYRTREAH